MVKNFPIFTKIDGLISGVNVTGNVIKVKQCEKFFRCAGCGIEARLAKITEDLGTAVVLPRSDPLKVGGTPIEDVAVDVVHDHLIALLVGDLSVFEPRERHEYVTARIT